MAWLEQCQIEACAQIDKLKEQAGGAKPAMKILARESGIPAATMKRWYWPNKSRKSATLPSKPKKQSLETCAVSDLDRLIEHEKKFGTIYCDPPWKYSNQATRSCTDDHYETMTPDEIAALPIENLAKEKAHLHLWTTNAFLFECPKIFEAWGFEYKGVFVWVKPRMGIGNYWRVSHEFLLLGVRGGLRFYDQAQMSWLHIESKGHSQKPEAIAEIIEKVSPGPYLELFGRRTRENWTVWGNEIERTFFNAAAFGDK